MEAFSQIIPSWAVLSLLVIGGFAVGAVVVGLISRRTIELKGYGLTLRVEGRSDSSSLPPGG